VTMTRTPTTEPTIRHLLDDGRAGRPRAQRRGDRLEPGVIASAAAATSTARREAEEHARAAVAAAEALTAPPVRIGIVGYGYWGPNLVRNVALTPGAKVAAVCDLQDDRLAPVRAQYPTVRTTTRYADLLDDPEIDAIAVATPVRSHYPLALQALQAGKHVFVEKPLAQSAAEAHALVEEAERRDRVLMVDHTFVYTGAVQRIKELVDEGQLGKLYYFDSTRVNLGLFQHDIDVMWDLAVHDLAIMDYVLGRRPYAVAASGAAHVPGKPINIAYLTCHFDDSLIAHVNVNWLAPVKIRRTLIGGDRKMIVFDDLEPSEKVKVYDRGITLDEGEDGDAIEAAAGRYEMLVGYRTGDMWAPKVYLGEALNVEMRHFVECVRTGQRPLTDGMAGLRVVRILEAATESLAQGGCPVSL
jgi:predicted dehydrogenase